ncbi:MAG: molybdate ABC transporter substrate-binding protein [Candidatus Tectomicrobia bacterium]|nr:molybdate ABC transporter substrate-binding protein [Candidatus Tectomicrobia bacterium]
MVFWLLVAWVGVAQAQPLTVSTAASLRDTFREIARAFEAAHPGVRVRLNLGASGTLQQQIEQGAPVDVFASAALPQMDALERQGLLVPESRRSFATNRLALVVPNSASPELGSFAALTSRSVARIAMGDPRSVPAGGYAKEVFEHLGLWEELRPKLIFSSHVRQALDYVTRREVDAAVVYLTDAQLQRHDVRLAALADAAWHRPIRYPVAVLRDAPQRKLAAVFVEFVTGPRGRDLLQRFGFGLPEAAAK